MLSAYSSVAIAQQVQVGTLTYGPGVEASPIPGLSGVMTLVLTLLVFAIAFMVIKRRTAGPLLSVLSASLLAGLFSVAGGQLISDAYAPPYTPLSNPNGGTVAIFDGQVNNYGNTSGVEQTILEINIEPQTCVSFPTQNEGECAVGDSYVSGGGVSCAINCSIVISDARLKHEISYLAELDNGIRVYSFKYNWSDEAYVGVMAQDLLENERYQDAVSVMENNYYAVDYSKLGFSMMTLDKWEQFQH